LWIWELILKKNLVFFKATVFKPSFLINPEGKYLGYPYRNHVKGTKLYGYSDHFTIYIIVGKKTEAPITPPQSQGIKNGYRENGLYEFFELQHIRVS